MKENINENTEKNVWEKPILKEVLVNKTLGGDDTDVENASSHS